MTISFNRLLTFSRIFLAAVGMALCAFSEAAFHYTAAPIEAKVVYHDTNEPVVGAVVVAHWQLVEGGWDGPHDKGQLEVMETLTDKDGKFSFPGFKKMNLSFAELRNYDPRILIFKAGYEPQIITNQHDPEKKPGSHRTAAINGQTVRLKKLAPTHPEIQGSPYSELTSGLDTLIFRDCGWKKIPRLILALDEESKRLRSLYPEKHMYTVSFEATIEAQQARRIFGCGSAVEFFRGYKK